MPLAGPRMEPSDMLITSTPASVALRTARAALSRLPLPAPSSTLKGTMVASGATPATPLPLFVHAPMMPATCVPWPLSSSTLLLGSM
jgi:hypothetical protein